MNDLQGVHYLSSLFDQRELLTDSTGGGGVKKCLSACLPTCVCLLNTHGQEHTDMLLPNVRARINHIHMHRQMTDKVYMYVQG